MPLASGLSPGLPSTPHHMRGLFRRTERYSLQTVLFLFLQLLESPLRGREQTIMPSYRASSLSAGRGASPWRPAIPAAPSAHRLAELNAGAAGPGGRLPPNVLWLCLEKVEQFPSQTWPSENGSPHFDFFLSAPAGSAQSAGLRRPPSRLLGNLVLGIRAPHPLLVRLHVV